MNESIISKIIQSRPSEKDVQEAAWAACQAAYIRMEYPQVKGDFELPRLPEKTGQYDIRGLIRDYTDALIKVRVKEMKVNVKGPYQGALSRLTTALNLSGVSNGESGLMAKTMLADAAHAIHEKLGPVRGRS